MIQNMGMRYGILGSTLVLGDDHRPVPLPGGRLRALLAALALREGRAAQPWALIEEIWGESGPADPQDALQTLVARLRRALGPDRVGSGPEGYRLLGGDTDVAAFRALVAEAGGAPPARAAERLGEALALWRGPALADLPIREDAARRLEAEHAAALRARVEAELALGRAAQVLPELAERLAAEPLDEPWHLLHLRALHAGGRTADALRAYDSLRRALATELGADPSPALQAAYAQLLAPTAPTVPTAPTAPAAPAAPPRAGAEGRPPGNLPARVTSFVGREAELDALRAELPQARVLTLTGPGGTGKTRLAQQAGAALAGAYPDGVWQVELAPLDDPRAVVDAALGALGLRATHLGLGMSEPLAAAVPGAPGVPGADGPLGRLLEFCGPRELLLVLDNCEHLVQAAAELADRLVAHCPGVTVLATSREPLGVAGELVRPVEPLPEPTALRLLAERGAAARPGFDPADPAQDPEACAELCRRLDGLPLAIELAAARLRAMTPRQLAHRLDRRFTLLTGGSRTDLPRQQTLRAVVDWSWDLLEGPERTLLARLSVFAGGWTLDAAEAICADAAELPAEDVAPSLLSLVDKSLIQVDLTASGAGGPRYRMLETIHEYAAERLSETAASETAAPGTAAPGTPAGAHLRWFRELARTTDPLLRTDAQLDALRLLDAEHDNLRAALRRAVEAGEEQEALSLLCNLGWYWNLRNQRDEAHDWNKAVLALVPGDPFDLPAVPVTEGPCDLPPPWPRPVLEEARRAAVTGSLLTAEGIYGGVPSPEMRELGARIIAFYRPELPQSARMPALQRVYIVMYAGLLEQLQPVADGLVDGCRRFGRRWELACTLQIRSKLLNDQWDRRDQAERDAAESQRLFTEIGDRWGRAEALAGRAEIANFAGEFEEGARCCREAMELAHEVGADQEQPILRVRLGDALVGLGRYDEGAAELVRAIEESTAYGVIGQGAGMFGTMLLAGLRMRQQRLGEARTLLEGLLVDSPRPGAANLLNGMITSLLGAVEAMDGRPVDGLRRVRAGLEELRSHPLTPLVPEQLPLVVAPALTGTLWRCAEAGLVPEQDPARTAARILGAYEQLQTRSAKHQLDRAALAETAAGLRALLGDAGYEQAYAEGRAMDSSQTVRLMHGEADG
ncbi:putative ATPase/DNA-binding SARP family transcriptional activator [Streptacidiphilus sp. MAP12-33]|uniref:BTAD domain-containing putative transcriptional regulator n=1 Tax=Streptacidiphilus sp. MAP12-33 TaxID=3156266 RepID=UPI003513320F